MAKASAIYKLSGHPAGLVAALIHQFTKANPKASAVWIEAWSTDKDTGPYNPLGLVTKRIARIKKASQGPVQDLVRAALLVQAWNLYIQKRRGIEGDISWTIDEDFPRILSE